MLTALHYTYVSVTHKEQQTQDGEAKEVSALALKGLSARERNRAKRKARQMARRSSRDKNTPEKV